MRALDGHRPSAISQDLAYSVSVAADNMRLGWVDHLRTFAIALVVSMHACVTYSGLGGWYTKVGPGAKGVEGIVFGIWQGHLQSFFMGLLFLLAGSFAGPSLDRKGPRAFLRERALRLGLPALLYMAVLHPLIVLVLNPNARPHPAVLAEYGRYLLSTDLLAGNGPLWFVLALLVFSVVLAALPRASGPRGALPPLRARHIVAWGLGVGLASFLVRLVQPIGTDVLNFQLGYFPQYVAAFALGVALGRRKSLEALALSPVARAAGWLGLLLGPPLLGAVALGLGPVPDSGPSTLDGGPHLQAFAMAMWEQLTGAALGLGCLSLFARRFRGETPGWRWLDDRAFAVYVLHAPVLVALTMLLRLYGGDPLLMAGLLTLLGLAASFVVADLARRIPGLKRVL